MTQEHITAALVVLTVAAFVLLAWIALSFPNRRLGQDWTPANRPPDSARIVEVEFWVDWAANYGTKHGFAYYDPDFREWSLEGVQRWRNAR